MKHFLLNTEEHMMPNDQPLMGVLKKIKNVGSSDPFVARMMLGIFEIRDFVYRNETSRNKFDKHYSPILDNLFEVKDAKEKCVQLINKHSKDVADGSIVRWQNKVLQINENVDNEVNKGFKDFFIKGEIALQALGRLAQFMGFKISFFFQQDDKFEKGAAIFLAKKPGKANQNFIQMFRNDRKNWYELFNNVRNEVEHRGFKLPDTKYEVSSGKKVKAIFPLVKSESILEFLEIMWSNLFEFVEDTIIYFFGCKLQPPLKIGVVPENKRDKHKPVKYMVTVEPPPPIQ